MKVALSSPYKANVARRLTVHHGSSRILLSRVCESLRSRRNPGQVSTREQPRHGASCPAYDEEEFLR
jgi:hypothetical protein